VVFKHEIQRICDVLKSGIKLFGECGPPTTQFLDCSLIRVWNPKNPGSWFQNPGWTRNPGFEKFRVFLHHYFTDIPLNFEKNIVRVVGLLHFTDIPLNFEKNVVREVCLPHFTDIPLDFEKNIVREVCLLHFTDIPLNFEKKYS